MIAGVLKRQMDEAKTVGADQLVATDDDTAIANLPPLDAVADTVGGRTAAKLIAKVKPGGVFASVARNAAERRGVPICKGSVCLLAFRQGHAPIHGRSGARWQVGNPDRPRSCHSVKRPRLKQRRKRVASGRSCCCLDIFLGLASKKQTQVRR